MGVLAVAGEAGELAIAGVDSTGLDEGTVVSWRFTVPEGAVALIAKGRDATVGVDDTSFLSDDGGVVKGSGWV
jgi:hypothetical protein